MFHADEVIVSCEFSDCIITRKHNSNNNNNNVGLLQHCTLNDYIISIIVADACNSMICCARFHLKRIELNCHSTCSSIENVV